MLFTLSFVIKWLYVRRKSESIIASFENFILEVQKSARREYYKMDNVQLKTVSKQDFGIINLTNKDIPKELEEFLHFGANYAPHVPLSCMQLKELYGNDLLAATRNMFIDTYKQFPFQNKKGDVTGNLKLLLYLVVRVGSKIF